jgi:hypothetical protein
MICSPLLAAEKEKNELLVAKARAEIMGFLGPVPTVWDETKVLAAQLGDYVAWRAGAAALVGRRHDRLDRS